MRREKGMQKKEDNQKVDLAMHEHKHDHNHNHDNDCAMATVVIHDLASGR